MIYKNRQTFAALWVHLIWSTKYREPTIVPTLKYKLYDHIRKVSKDKGYHLDFINGVTDHVHLLYSLKPNQLISTLVKDIKGNTWSWVNDHQHSETYFTWQDGYAAISVSPSNVPKVRNYIRNQEIHHHRMSFEEELDGLKDAVIVPPL
ncbi:MAG: IS200/IS605 family transposase [Chitinophagales bacterium]